MSGPVLGGRYELGELLGRGGMAEVYRARDTVLDRDVAIKRFRTSEVHADDLRRTGEIRMLAGLSHPGIVTVHDAGEQDGAGYLVMELVTGRTLRDRLTDGPLGSAETARLGAELAAALGYVHSRGIVHRDVKPANILLTEDGTAKLTDFGVAKLLDGTRLTTTGTTVGTANYLSPEQATGAPITGASDVYSLGLVLLECLTGAVAFPGHGVTAAVLRMHRDPDVPASLGPGWARLLTAMTQRDPASRPAPAAVVDTLAAISTGSLAPTTQLAVPPDAPTAVAAAVVPEPADRRRRWLPAAIGVTVAGIAALAAVLAISAGSDDPATGGAPADPGSSAPPRTSASTHPQTSSTSRTSATTPSSSHPRSPSSSSSRSTRPTSSSPHPTHHSVTLPKQHKPKPPGKGPKPPGKGPKPPGHGKPGG